MTIDPTSGLGIGAIVGTIVGFTLPVTLVLGILLCKNNRRLRSKRTTDAECSSPKNTTPEEGVSSSDMHPIAHRRDGSTGMRSSISRQSQESVHLSGADSAIVSAEVDVASERHSIVARVGTPSENELPSVPPTTYGNTLRYTQLDIETDSLTRPPSAVMSGSPLRVYTMHENRRNSRATSTTSNKTAPPAYASEGWQTPDNVPLPVFDWDSIHHNQSYTEVPFEDGIQGLPRAI